MLGAYDFCGHYEWTFQWLDQKGGHDLVRAYWLEAISKDSQLHARDLIFNEGFEGMLKYWGHTLLEESPAQEFSMSHNEKCIRIDMHDCPSKGFLLRNNLEQYRDYCDHCMGWIGPMLGEAGYVIDHQHNHCGQCWWEIRKADDVTTPSKLGEFCDKDVRLMQNWKPEGTRVDTYHRANDADDKTSQTQQ